MDINEAQFLFNDLVRKHGLPADRAGTHSGVTHIHVTISPRLRTVDAKVLPSSDGHHKAEIRLSEAYVLKSDPQAVRKTVLSEIRQVIRAHPDWLTLMPAGPGEIRRMTAWQKAMLAAGVQPRIAQKLIRQARRQTDATRKLIQQDIRRQKTKRAK